MVIKRKIDSATTSILGRIGRFRLARMRISDMSTLVSKRSLQLIYVVIISIFSAGTVNAILEGGRLNVTGAPVLASRYGQTIAESAINFSAIAIGTLGFYLVFIGGRQALRGRIAIAFILSGLLLVLIGLLVGFFVLSLKGY